MARPVLILDAAMNDLARPALYGAWHGIVPVSPGPLHAVARPADIVGPVCESADVFARGRMIADLPDGAVVAILDCGAYGAVMSSTYNARAPAAQVLADPTLPGGWALIGARPPLARLWADERVPDRRAGAA
jgi:diaminopimelate decarboxylase